jgi:hypothetical protein
MGSRDEAEKSKPRQNGYKKKKSGIQVSAEESHDVKPVRY